jgi:hypothetical protein
MLGFLAMNHPNSRGKRSILLAGFAILLSAPADASLTVVPGVYVHNRCPDSIVVALRYKSVHGDWRTTDFAGINGNGEKLLASSDNSIFYYYAETMRKPGTVWAGDRSYTVEGKQYLFRRKELERRNNRYTLRLTCGG